jgi:UDP-galactopyranose mutase
MKLVEISDTADEFIAAAEKLLSRSNKSEWLKKVDAYLENISWDKTWAQMWDLIDEVIERKRPARTLPLNEMSKRAGAAAITR